MKRHVGFEEVGGKGQRLVSGNLKGGDSEKCKSGKKSMDKMGTHECSPDRTERRKGGKVGFTPTRSR